MRKGGTHRFGLGIAVLALQVLGCSSVPDRPPRTMGAGLIGYVTNCRFLPKVEQKTGGVKVKCSLAKVLDETSYGFGTALQKQAEDLFESTVSNSGQEIAAKEAVVALCRKIGVQDTSELWDPDRAKAFKAAIQQEGRSVVDFLLLVRLTGVSPALQVQTKIVSTEAGPDWGQQSQDLLEINWKQYCEEFGIEATSTAWDQRIRQKEGCAGAPSPVAPVPAAVGGGGGGAPAPAAVPVAQAPPPADVECTPEGKDLIQDLRRCFVPKLADVGGIVALFPPLWQNEEGAWVSKKLSEEIATGLEKLLRERRVASMSGGKLEGALQAEGNRNYFFYCQPEDAAALGQRIFSARATVGGEVEKVKPTPFTSKYRIRLWCQDWTGAEIAPPFDYTYAPDALIGGGGIERTFEFAASKPVCDRAPALNLSLDGEVRWAVNDMLYGMVERGVLAAGENLLVHPSGRVRVNSAAKGLERQLPSRLLGIIGATEFDSQGKRELNPSKELVAWVSDRINVSGLKVSPILDDQFAAFVRLHVEAFQDAPSSISEDELNKLVPQGQPVPDTMVLVKLRSPLLGNKDEGPTLSLKWSDAKSGEVFAWAEYQLPKQVAKEVPTLVTPTFFNQQLGEQKLVFVVDVSGSMNQLVPRLTVNRLDLTKQELARLIDSLPPDRQFQILPFSHGVGAWSPAGLVEANAANKAAAVGFVRSLLPQGETPARAALEKALEYNDAQALCFLSDGDPTDASPDQILQVVKQKNVPARKVYTFAFDGANVAFMTRLAEENGGRYQHIQ